MQKVFKDLLNCEQRISFRDSFHVDTKYGIFDYEKGKGSKRRKAQRKFFSRGKKWPTRPMALLIFSKWYHELQEIKDKKKSKKILRISGREVRNNFAINFEMVLFILLIFSIGRKEILIWNPSIISHKP